MEYPQYKSHKVVGAVKIESVAKGADGSLSVYLADGFDTVVLYPHDRQRANFVHAEPGWYLVRYEGGHLSASPGDVFEAGYSLIEREEPAVPAEAVKASKGGKRKPAAAEAAQSEA